MVRLVISFFTVLLSFFLLPLVTAKGIYEEPNTYLNRVFDQKPPKPQKLWIKNDVKDLIKDVLGHDLKVLRLRYWEKGDRLVWILEEVGRDKPITTGITISDNRIEEISVLVFRESRGWEVRHPFFTDQFRGVSTGSKKGLSKSIDGISGATLSVNALTKLATLALQLSRYVQSNTELTME